jgi:hypothetical protein
MRHSAGMRRYWDTMKRLMEECDEVMLAQQAELVFTSHQDVAEAVNAHLLQLAPPTSANSAEIATMVQPVLAEEAPAASKAIAASVEKLQQPVQQPVRQVAQVPAAAPMQSLQPPIAEATARTDATAVAAATATAAGYDDMAVVAHAGLSADSTAAPAAAAAAASDDDMAVAEPSGASATTATAAADAAAGVAAEDREPDAAPTTRGSKKRRRAADDSTTANAVAPTAAVVQYGQDPKLFLKGVCIYIVNRGSISSKMIEVSVLVL